MAEFECEEATGVPFQDWVAWRHNKTLDRMYKNLAWKKDMRDLEETTQGTAPDIGINGTKDDPGAYGSYIIRERG